VNRCRRRLFGRIERRQHVEATLGQEQVIYIGEEPMALESINTGAPMALNRSYGAIRKDIAALATLCSSVTSVRASDLADSPLHGPSQEAHVPFTMSVGCLIVFR
jgi:hypothetical protein